MQMILACKTDKHVKNGRTYLDLTDQLTHCLLVLIALLLVPGPGLLNESVSLHLPLMSQKIPSFVIDILRTSSVPIIQSVSVV